MAVDVENGVEPLQQRDHRAGFRGIRLGIVAVQIDVARIADIAFFQRAAQGWKIPAAHPFMPVDIVDRHEDQIDLVQQPVLAALRDIAQQHQARILAVNLAGVDARLHQDDGLARPALAGAHHQQIPPLARAAETLDRDERRSGG